MMRDMWHKFTKDKVQMLIIINIAVFVLVRLMDLLSMAGSLPYQWVLDYLMLPSSDITVTITTRPWTILTYMFTHYDFIHIIFNLIALFWFGKLMMYLEEEQMIVRTYIIGGIAGAIAYFATPETIVPVYSPMLGASASVMALIIYVAVLNPKHTVRLVLIGNVKLGILAAVYVLIDILSIPGMSNVGGHIAHIGGAVAGLVLALMWKKKWMTAESGISFFPKKKSHLKIVRGGLADADMEWNRQQVNRIAEIDRILDKIKASGYESLTEDERQTLLNESKK